MTIVDMLLIMVVCGAMIIGNGMLVGWLVYRTKREAHEPLAPARIKDEQRGPVHMDEFAPPGFAPPVDDAGLADVTRKNLKRMEEAMGIDIMGEGK